MIIDAAGVGRLPRPSLPGGGVEIISRAEANAAGLPRYFTGKPCKHGHVAERYTSYGGCVPCAFGFAYSYRERDPEWWASYMAKWREENPGKPREYYWNEPEKYRKRSRQNYHENKPRHRANNRRYKRENPEANVAREQRRRARERNAPGDHTADDVKRIYRQQRGRCLNCRASLKDGYHVDHIVPLARGGSNWPGNLQLLCPPCNIAKGAKDPIEWAQKNGRLL